MCGTGRASRTQRVERQKPHRKGRASGPRSGSIRPGVLMINQPRHGIVQPLRRAMEGFQHGVGTDTISTRVQRLGNLVQAVADVPELASRGKDLDKRSLVHWQPQQLRGFRSLDEASAQCARKPAVVMPETWAPALISCTSGRRRPPARTARFRSPRGDGRDQGPPARLPRRWAREPDLHGAARRTHGLHARHGRVLAALLREGRHSDEHRTPRPPAPLRQPADQARRVREDSLRAPRPHQCGHDADHLRPPVARLRGADPGRRRQGVRGPVRRCPATGRRSGVAAPPRADRSQHAADSVRTAKAARPAPSQVRRPFAERIRR